jgi:hypothetical protein
MRRGFAWLGSFYCIACTVDRPVDEDGSSTTSMMGTTLGVDDTTLGVDDTTTQPPETTTVELDTTASEATTDESTTTGPPPACDEPDGTFGGDCPDTSPFCVSGECVPCSTDNALTVCTRAPELVCDPSGECVMCSEEETAACEGETPTCDPETHTCVPCTEHSQCGPSACNLFTGECVPGQVVTVGVGQQHSNLISAVTALGAGGGTIIVYDGIYNETLTIGGGAIVAFLANQGDSPNWQRTLGPGAPHLRVTAASTVFLDGIELRSNSSSVDPALRVDGASLWVDRSVIAENQGVAVSAENAATLVLRNSFLGGTIDLPVLNTELTSTVDIRYSTLGAGLGDSTAVLCDGGSLVTVSDSIIISRGDGPEVVCAALAADHTASNSMLPGSANVEVGAAMTMWFAAYNTGDFHLSASGEAMFMDIAQWNDGDPSVDIDGMLRSGIRGMSEHAGADLP